MNYWFVIFIAFNTFINIECSSVNDRGWVYTDNVITVYQSVAVAFCLLVAAILHFMYFTLISVYVIFVFVIFVYMCDHAILCANNSVV